MAMHGDTLSTHAGCAVKLTMVLVHDAIGTTDWLVVRFAVRSTDTLRQVGCPVDQTFTALGTFDMRTGI